MKEKKLFTCPILDKICPILVIFQQILLYIGLETRYVPQILLINYLMSTRINIPNEEKKLFTCPTCQILDKICPILGIF